MQSETAMRPKYGSLDVWLQISGVGRSKTYDMLKSGELLGIKVGRRLLIDVEAGLATLAAMPPARIGRSKETSTDRQSANVDPATHAGIAS